MSSLHIASRGQLLGTFDEEEVREGMRTARFTGEELVWCSGMSDWRPLSEMATEWKWDLASEESVTTTSKVSSSLKEPAWEQRATLGFFSALLQTIGTVLLKPSKTFEGLQKQGGVAAPLFYYVMISSVMFTVAAISQLPSTISSLASVMPQFEKVSLSYPMMGMLFLVTLLLSPPIFMVTIFVSSFFTHLCLRLLRGAKEPFEATFRVMCYAMGSTAIFQVIPFFGGILGSIWSFYASLIGLKKVHEISAWRATVALLLSSLILLVLLALLVSLLYYSYQHFATNIPFISAK